MKTKKEYKDIKIMKLNSPTKNGLIFTEVSLPKQTMVDYRFNNKSVGIATNFRIEKDFVICDISLNKKLSKEFNNAYPFITGFERNMEINKGELKSISIGDVAHSFKECENNLKKTEKEYNPLEDELEQLTKHVDETIAKEVVKIKKEKEELKTLKDLELDFNYLRKDSPSEILEQNIKNLLYEHKQIRNEAIKWIKEIRKKQKEHVIFKINKIEFYYSREREDWIKHFFNISEEDLK